MRKAAVKEGRREARILKKSLKDAFKREGTQHDRLTSSYDAPLNTRVKRLE